MTIFRRVYVVVKMGNGREALPIWTIPYVTSGQISADGLLLRLVEPNRNDEPAFPTVFSLDAQGNPLSIPSIDWIKTKRMIELLDIEIRDKKLSPTKDREEWERRSVDIILQNRKCYIWLDELKRWLERINNHRIASIENVKNEQGYIAVKLELFLNPLLLEEHAHRFEETELRKDTSETSADYEIKEKIGNATSRPWETQDPKDPDPICPWYTPARYFARQHVQDDPTLLSKTELLVQKIANSLDKVGVKKRGGKKPLSPSTIKKALSKVNYG